MPAPTRSRVPVEKLTVTLPATLYRDMGEIVRADGGYMSIIDFMREAAREKIDRWRKEHPLWSPPAKDRPKW